MNRDQKIDLVERFLSCMETGDLERLPISRSFSVETPLLPRCSGESARAYMRATAASTRRVRVLEHIVDGNRVATLSENLTPNGPLQVVVRFVIENDEIVDARVFYDPRVLLDSPAT